MDVTSLSVVLALIVVLMSVVVWTLRTGVPPMPTGPATRAELLGTLPPDPGGTVFELGSGWGGLAFALAKCYPGHRVIGYELSPVPWLWAVVRHALLGPPNLSLRRADFLKVDLSPSRLVVCYLCPSGMQQLGLKLESELSRGAAVVSHFYAMPGWHAEQPVTRAPDRSATPIYLYRFPQCLAPHGAGGIETRRSP